MSTNRKIPIALSSQATVDSIAASTLAVGVHENRTGVTGDKAPLLLSVRGDGEVDADKFATMVAELSGDASRAPEARLVLNALCCVIAKYAKDGAFTAKCPLGTIATQVDGSIKNATDEPGEDNVPYVGVTLSPADRKFFASFTTYVPTGACPADIYRVHDIATGVKSICGADAFMLECSFLTLGGEGESIALHKLVTGEKVADIAFDPETLNESQVECHLVSTAAVGKGDYEIRATTLSSHGDGKTLWPIRRKVTLSKDYEPSSDGPTVSGITPDKLDFGQTGDKITGTGLDLGEGDTLKLQLIEGGSVSETVDLTDKITAKSDSSITFDMPERGDVDDPNAWYDEDNEKNLVITKSGYAPVEFAVEFDA